MKILLLNPFHSDELFKDIKDLNLSVLRWNSETEFSLELAYIAAILRKQEHHVSIIDAHSNKLSNPDLKEYITKFNPQIIGISSSLGWKFHFCLEEIRLCLLNFTKVFGQMDHNLSLLLGHFKRAF